MITHELIEALEKILDSRDTTVGGGGASALSGAMAAGMVGMVARLSAKKPVNLSVEQYEAVAEECDALSEQLTEGCAADMRAYTAIVESFRLPKATEEEKAARSAAVQAAAIRAAEVPLENARRNARVHELGASLRGNSNPACLSDLTCALYLSDAGLKDCILNVNANLSLIRDEDVTARLKDAMLELLLQEICY